MGAVHTNEKADIYRLGELIAKEIASNFKTIKWYNVEIMGEVKRIVDEYPEILSVLEEMYGERFVLSFIESIND